jgi:predicted HAD superfamily Cof-like phosphohydrolase
MSEHYDVGIFHQKFGLNNTIDSTPGPRTVNKELFDFRVKFMDEELKEFKDAAAIGDHAGMFDALMDLTYVAAGFAHLMGYPWQEGWDLVQAANMSKVRAQRADQSERGGTWDVVKPEGFQPPDIEALVKRYGFKRTRICTVCRTPILDITECYTVNPTPSYQQYAHDACADKAGLK